MHRCYLNLNRLTDITVQWYIQLNELTYRTHTQPKNHRIFGCGQDLLRHWDHPAADLAQRHCG